MRGTGRAHDDCDGDLFQRLELLQGDDGDMHISTDGVTFLRFRMPIIGGGLSEHTYDALRALFEAIELDNNERPIVPNV